MTKETREILAYTLLGSLVGVLINIVVLIIIFNISEIELPNPWICMIVVVGLWLISSLISAYIICSERLEKGFPYRTDVVSTGLFAPLVVIIKFINIAPQFIISVFLVGIEVLDEGLTKLSRMGGRIGD